MTFQSLSQRETLLRISAFSGHQFNFALSRMVSKFFVPRKKLDSFIVSNLDTLMIFLLELTL